MADIGGSRPLTEAHPAELFNNQYVKVGSFSVLHHNILEFVLGIASSVKVTVDMLEGKQWRILTVNIITVYMTVCNRISSIVVVRNRDNGPDIDPENLLLYILPSELVKISLARFLSTARIMAS